MDFDWDWYLFQNNDLVNAGITTPKGALDHYLHHGKHELRKYVIDWNSKEAMYLYKIYLKCLPDNISDHIDTPLSVNKYYKQYGNVKYDTKITTLLNIGCSFANCDYFLSIDDFSKIYYPGNTVKSTYDIIKKDPKIEFRYFCYRYLDYIRQYSIPDIKLNNYKEAVLIEFRDFPHIEFTIRNCIHKLGNSWSFTVVCGLGNQMLVKDICNNISDNIKIVVIDYYNIDVRIYNELLTSKTFWNKMCGEKILIYQEDSCIFRKGIDEFLQYDYIGAPWPHEYNLNKLSVGNGGFSLRSKKVMLQVINTINVKDTTCNIEDIYFTRVMVEHNIGSLANWTEASRFSIENIYNSKAISGHNFWLCDPNWKKHLYETVVIQMNPDHDSLKGINYSYHHGGWKTVLNTLIKTDFYNLNDIASHNFLDMLECYAGPSDPTKDTICIFHGTKD